MNIFNVILIQPLANGLVLFYRLLGGNMGLAIIGFSTALRFLTLPLTKPYMESMKKMKEIEPQLSNIKKRPKAAKTAPGQADDIESAMQQSMTFTFPLFTLIIGLSFPSGLALYWLLFSFWQAYQQYRTSGWGGLTPFVSRLGLVQSKP